jgi:IPT/TIG domain
MHVYTPWAVRMLAALVICLSTGSFVLAGPFSKLDAPPVVIRAAVDRVEPDRLVIRGTNFGVTTAPVVMLASTPLEVLSFNDEEIVARLPLDVPAARYRLQVLVPGGSSSPFVEIALGRRPDRRSEG